MADDQVKYSDLFEANIKTELDALQKSIIAIRDAIADAKTEAEGMKKALSGMGTATRDQQQSTAADAAAVESLSKQVKDLTDKLTKLEEKKKSLTGLAKDEESAVKALQQALKGEAKEQQAAAESLDSTNMSYNHMKASVAALQQALRGFATEEKKTSDEAKAMETAVENLRNAMKDLDNQTKSQANTEKETAKIYKESAKSRSEDEKSSSAMIKQAIKEREDAAKAEAAGREAYDKHMSDMMLNSAKAMVDASKEEAKAAQDAHSAKQRELEEAFKAYDAEQKAEAKRAQEVQNTTDAIRRNYEAEKQRLKLTDEEYTAVSQLRVALQGTSQEQIAAMQNLEIQNKSYNELYQTYNAIKDVLNAMTVAERENTEEGKMMVNRAKEIRDTLNNLQQQTGNYTLQVGKYKAAFDGLGYSFQQILREAPSALNIQQFFLAISNNIPMFMDQLDGYNKKQKEIKEELKRLEDQGQKSSEAYKDLSKSVEGWGKHLLKNIVSWQTAIIAITMLIRYKGADIVNWVKKLFVGVREVKNELTATAAMGELMAGVAKKTADEVTELNLIVDRLKDVKRGTDEWNAGIATVNKITKKNLDTTTATIAEVQKVTDAYTKQAEQLAKNAILTDMIGKSNANQVLRDVAYSAADYDTARATLGLKIDSKEEKQFKDLYEAMAKRRSGLKFFEDRRSNPAQTTYSVSTGEPIRIASGEDQYQEQKKLYEQSLTEYKNFVNKRLSVLSPEAVKKLESEYDLMKPFPTGKGHTYTAKDVDFLESELLDKDAVIELETNFKRRLAMLDEEQEKERLVLKEKYEKELKDLEFNKDKKLITEEQYEEQLARLNKNYNDLIKTNYEGNFEEMGVIQRKYWNKRNELAFKEADRQEKEEEKRLKKAEQAAKDGAKAELKAAVDGWAEYKAKLVEEGKTRKQIVEAEVAAEIARLKLMQDLNRDVNGEIMSDEQKAKVQEWINLLEKLQQTGNYGDYKPGQFMGKGGANVTNERKNYANIWEVLGIDMDNNQVSALNSVFDQAKEALNSWMDARKAAADQAKELADDEVSAAENALNREIELRNQGYANDVALREKELADAKAAQKKAAEEQKKVAQEQVLLDAALQTSSMITASANIIKQFPNPLAWAPMLALMWGTFAYAKTKAYQASTKSIKFKEGGVMLLEGGSHESGHDVNLGVGPDGSNLRAEGGEYFAVINKRSSRKYGSQIPAVVNALNSGMFEDRYIKTSDAVGLLPQVIRADNGTAIDLSSLEGGVDALVKQGESRWSVEGEYRVMRYKNLTRRVRIS